MMPYQRGSCYKCPKCPWRPPKETEVARIKFLAWKASLTQEMRKYVCDLCFDVPFPSATGTCGFLYVCRNCSAKRTVATMRRDTCKDKPKRKQGGLTKAQWQRKVHGAAQVDTQAAATHVRNGSLKQKEWRRTPEGKEYFRKKMSDASRKNRELFNDRAKAFYARNASEINDRRRYVKECKRAERTPVSLVEWRKRQVKRKRAC